MFDCNCYLYVAPIAGEENSVDRQIKSGKAFGEKCITSKFKRIFIEKEDETDMPVYEREAFNEFLYCYCDSENRPTLFMDITVLNNMNLRQTKSLKDYLSFMDIIIISDGGFVANFGTNYPFAVSAITLQETKMLGSKDEYRIFSNVVGYCCYPEKDDTRKYPQFILAENFSSLVTATKNLHVYVEPDIYNSTYINERKHLNPVLNRIRAGEFDLFISFKEAFRPDELDGVISEIRRYVPVILVDEDERFSFLDKSE